MLSAVPSMAVLKAYLKLAGVPFETSTGRADLHAMRKSLATMLAARGVPQRTAQAHLRHTDPRLTAGVYTDENLLPTAAAISSLPSLPTTAAPGQAAAVATGTDGPVPQGEAQRAAHAQRAGLIHRQNGALECAEGDAQRGLKRSARNRSAVCNARQGRKMLR